MDAFIVRGGRPLAGTVRVSGAKNSALKLAAAALLAQGRSTLTNVPDIADLQAMAAVLRHLGVATTAAHGALTLDVPAEIGTETPDELARALRASIVVLGPLLARCGHARVPQPGGCNLGNRGIDLHLTGLAALGAEVTIGPDFVEARADRLVGTTIDLPYASVGATENILMAAVTAVGETRISNAAREPEIADLAAYLDAMGADISGAGTSEIVVRGVGELQPADHAVVGDRIEAGTYAVAAALTGGPITVAGVAPAHLGMALDRLRAAGVTIEEHDDAVTVTAPEHLRAIDVVTLPFPGFPTDLQPQLLVLLSQAHGTAALTENVFDGRFPVIEQLARLGADVHLDGHHAIVRGPRTLRGTTVCAPDLRAGAALVLAGLVADGETVVSDAHHIDRGYTDLAGRLRALGADVERGGAAVTAGAA